MKILANDGISQSGIDALEAAGHQVYLVHVAQEQLVNYINEHQIDVLLVRSATKVRKDLIDQCPSLKIIGRGGVGMDNIDVEYARSKDIIVINTPAASSASVAELAFAHLFGAVRFLHHANRDMPLEGDSKFKELKKSYSRGVELRGKTLGLIGYGRIAQEMAKLAIGIGMKVVVTRKSGQEIPPITLNFFDGQQLTFTLSNLSMDELLKESDYISLHVPAQTKPILGKEEFDKMKDGVGIINTARGGIVDENALVEALETEKVSFAALDVFENEPSPSIKILMNNKISLSPHIGGSTVEAQDRIGSELAEQIIALDSQFQS
ncbi:MAG: 3-phosphoglycerate dehydrogenase [Bacteroidetes bacterium]|jgi:D-3-phosphoglycerate dehydrogenase|nr:3-phosphoglycerate dehydrogenase [Bacteroidota bacterium]